MSLLTWKDGKANVRGVEFRVFSDGWLEIQLSPKAMCPLNFHTEAEARTAAEEIATSIFGSEEVWLCDGCVFETEEEAIEYVSSDYAKQYAPGLTVQRGLFVPLEGE